MSAFWGAGLGYRRSLGSAMAALPLGDASIDFIEVAPENWLHVGGAARRLFDAACERWPLACHGLSLSLGGHDPLDMSLLAEIRAFMARYGWPVFFGAFGFCGRN